MNGPEVQKFDFRTPGRMADEYEQLLDRWSQGMCAILADRWNQLSPHAVAISTAQRRVVQTARALEELPETAIAYRLHLGGSRTPTLIVFARGALRTLVMWTLGESLQNPADDRILTSVELSLAEVLLQELAAAFVDSWSGSPPLACHLDGIETKPSRSRIFPTGKNLVVSLFQVNEQEHRQPWTWLMPQDLLKELFASQITRNDVGKTDRRELLEQIAAEIPLELSVRLGSTSLTISELANLQVGDAVLFEQKVSEPLVASVGDVPMYHGRLGRINSRQAFQIESSIES